MYLIGFKGVGDLWQLGQFVPPAIYFNVALCYTPYAPGTCKSTHENFGKPAKSFSDFYL